MAAQPELVEQLFEAALAREPGERAAFLDQACSHDPELRRTVEELLADYNFFRVHNSHLINLAYIKSYNKGKGGSVTMTDLSTVEVSTRRKEEFLKRLSEG